MLAAAVSIHSTLATLRYHQRSTGGLTVLMATLLMWGWNTLSRLLTLINHHGMGVGNNCFQPDHVMSDWNKTISTLKPLLVHAGSSHAGQ